MFRAVVECEACHRRFSPSGLTNHLAQTHNPPCVALRQSQLAFVPWIPAVQLASMDPDDDNDNEMVSDNDSDNELESDNDDKCSDSD